MRLMLTLTGAEEWENPCPRGILKEREEGEVAEGEGGGGGGLRWFWERGREGGYRFGLPRSMGRSLFSVFEGLVVV